MTRVLSTAAPPRNPLERIPTWVLLAVVIVITLGAMALATAITAQQEAAEAAAEGAESSFELEDMYETWSWLVIGATCAATLLYGFKKGWAFASTVQITLIVALTVCFLLLAQTIDRDIYGVGILALIGFTLLQIPFGNIPPTANFRLSLIGVVIGALIIGAIVLFSIWLVPSLIMLGR